jgi:hypothetical protein
MSEDGACWECGGSDFQMVVHLGSYILTCKACGASVATSFIAVAPLLTGEYRASIIDDDWREIEQVGQGSGPAFIEVVRSRARAGHRVLITPVSS